jgi:Second Messenger Oligonucleotide or Dinucleotide Synthetase domain
MSALPSFDASVRNAYAAQWLELLGRELDLTDTQYERAKQHYEAVGRWLGESSHPWLAHSTIFAHGSFGLGVVKKPLSGDEFDVDLVQNLIHATASTDPAVIKALVGDRLKEHGLYSTMLKEMPSCWRLEYANEFHLDISPTVPHRHAPPPALYIPDRRLQCWMSTNPIGFRELFERRAALRPEVYFAEDMLKAEVEPFPLQRGIKGIFRGLIQLLKHHRDLMFQSPALTALLPISIIITSLAARAYEHAVRSRRTFQSDYDLIVAVVELMPTFITVTDLGQHRHYAVWNETVTGENFAEKWNKDPNLAQAFYTWHARALETFKQIGHLQGLDQLAKLTSSQFGVGVGERIARQLTARTSALRSTNQLSVHSTLGISTMVGRSATTIRPNTFHGK